MSLLDLPNELLLYIAEYLELESDINALTRTTRRLHGLLNVSLYRHNVEHGESSALSWASRRGRVTTVQMLISEGASLRKSSGSYNSAPLSIAAAFGHTEVVKLLLALEGIDINFYTFGPYRQPPLS